jgi:hypothetical protein
VGSRRSRSGPRARPASARRRGAAAQNGGMRDICARLWAKQLPLDQDSRSSCLALHVRISRPSTPHFAPFRLERKKQKVQCSSVPLPCQVWRACYLLPYSLDRCQQTIYSVLKAKGMKDMGRCSTCPCTAREPERRPTSSPRGPPAAPTPSSCPRHGR